MHICFDWPLVNRTQWDRTTENMNFNLTWSDFVCHGNRTNLMWICQWILCNPLKYVMPYKQKIYVKETNSYQLHKGRHGVRYCDNWCSFWHRYAAVSIKTKAQWIEFQIFLWRFRHLHCFMYCQKKFVAEGQKSVKSVKSSYEGVKKPVRRFSFCACIFKFSIIEARLYARI